jgi:hypothetical protein
MYRLFYCPKEEESMPEKLNRESIMSELEQLQLEETRERVEQMRRNRAARLARHANRQRDIQSSNARIAAQQAACWHKKGGKGVEMLSHGNDANYAVIKHTLSHGPLIVICQRCNKMWEPPAKELRKQDPARYKVLYDEYMWAVNLPTDNESSGTQLFVIGEAVA